MYLSTLTALTMFGMAFGVIAALSRDKLYLLPMAGILFMAGSMILLSGSVQVQDGVNIHKVDVDANTTNVTERYHYQGLDAKYPGLSSISFSTGLAMLYWAIALYSFLIGADLSGTLRG